MNIAEKLETIAENEQRVYDSGYSKAESDFWDVVQDYGERTGYSRAFAYWGGEYLSPKYKVAPTNSCSGLFNGNKTKNIDKSKFDLSMATYDDTGSGSSTYNLCAYCNNLEEFPDIGLQAGYYGYSFSDCYKLHTIEVLRINKNCGVTTTSFRNCQELKNMVIEGEIGKNFPISYSPLLTQASINSIIDHLANLTGETAQKLTFHSTVADNLTDEQVLKITSKNWTIS